MSIIKSHIFIIGLVSLISFSCKKEVCDLSDIGTSTITDIDGHVYPTVIIHGQEWMAKNLNVTRFANGDTIEQVKPDSLWKITNSPAYVYYLSDSVRQENLFYGKLYNFHAAVDDKNICPEGWHVSTKSDWEELIECMGGEYKAGIKLKEAGKTSTWMAPSDQITDNESQFTAIPQGGREENGNFINQAYSSYFWGFDNNPTLFSMSYLSEGIAQFEVKKRFGGSVRCVKD